MPEKKLSANLRRDNTILKINFYLLLIYPNILLSKEYRAEITENRIFNFYKLMIQLKGCQIRTFRNSGVFPNTRKCP